LAPVNRATTALTPTPIPIKIPVVRVIRVVVEPTDPRAIGPENLPTIATSDKLNKTCKIFEHIKGKEYIMIFFGSDPVVKSISRVLICKLISSIYNNEFFNS
jgi:hypothetical protein